MQVVSSAIIDKYIGESARLIREMFGYARDHQVMCQIIWIIFQFVVFHLEIIVTILSLKIMSASSLNPGC